MYENRETLLDIARGVAQNARCSYSHFRVGSALLANGLIYTGVNVEINGYGHFICAERSAIVAAISGGSLAITELAVACIDAPENAHINKLICCRTCRQWLADLAPDCQIYVHGTTEIFHTGTLSWMQSCSRGDFRKDIS